MQTQDFQLLHEYQTTHAAVRHRLVAVTASRRVVGAFALFGEIAFLTDAEIHGTHTGGGYFAASSARVGSGLPHVGRFEAHQSVEVIYTHAPGI